MHFSTYPFVNLFIHPSIHPSLYLFIYCIYLSIYLPIYLPTYLYIYLFQNPSPFDAFLVSQDLISGSKAGVMTSLATSQTASCRHMHDTGISHRYTPLAYTCLDGYMFLFF